MLSPHRALGEQSERGGARDAPGDRVLLVGAAVAKKAFDSAVFERVKTDNRKAASRS